MKITLKDGSVKSTVKQNQSMILQQISAKALQELHAPVK